MTWAASYLVKTAMTGDLYKSAGPVRVTGGKLPSSVGGMRPPSRMDPGDLAKGYRAQGLPTQGNFVPVARRPADAPAAMGQQPKSPIALPGVKELEAQELQRRASTQAKGQMNQTPSGGSLSKYLPWLIPPTAYAAYKGLAGGGGEEQNTGAAVAHPINTAPQQQAVQMRQ